MHFLCNCLKINIGKFCDFLAILGTLGPIGRFLGLAMFSRIRIYVYKERAYVRNTRAYKKRIRNGSRYGRTVPTLCYRGYQTREYRSA